MQDELHEAAQQRAARGRAVTVKDRLHQLLDEFPAGEIADAAVRRLDELNRYGADLLARKPLSASIDDAPETDEERQLVQEARQELADGRVVRTSVLEGPWSYGG